MVRIGEFLSLLKGVESTGEDEWRALCPAHHDTKPSLSIKLRGNKILIHCFARCTAEMICAALGIEVKDLFIDRGRSRAAIVAKYDYHDEKGKLLFQVCRTHPKSFFQRRPDGNGGWINKLNGTRRVLYRLPELLSTDVEQAVLVVEGEKDVDRLWSEGLAATCNPGGQGQWRPEYGKALAGRAVAVLADNDAPGKSHARDVAKWLDGIARKATTVDLPDLPPKGDVSDWLDAGNSPEDLLRLVNEALSVPRSSDGFHCSDTGNAQRFASLYHDDVKYCHVWGKWFVYDSTRWREDTKRLVNQLAKESVLRIHGEAAEAVDSKDRQEISRWALISESHPRINALIDMAKSEPGIAVEPDELDSDPWSLNVANGLLDLHGGYLASHQRSHLVTMLCPVEYDPEAICPQWEKFLQRVLREDEDLIAYVQRVVGYSLTGDTSEHKLFFLYGTGANGKSTFLETIRAILGDYARNASFETFLARRGSGPRNDLARLKGSRIVTAQEAGADRKLAEDVVKSIVGGDTITTRYLYKEHFEYVPQFKLFLAANHKPTVSGTDHAIWRRIQVIPFTVRIPPDEQDKHLVQTLREESPGILTWAVKGCMRWRELGELREPKAVTDATGEYRTEMDLFGDFFGERCILDDQEETSTARLYEAYREWCGEHSEHCECQRRLGMTLRERGLRRMKRGGTAHWLGIGLVEMEDRELVDHLAGNSPEGSL